MKAVLDAGAWWPSTAMTGRRAPSSGYSSSRERPLRVSAAVGGQVWRDGRGQANLARVLAGVGTEALSTDDGKRIGELLALTGAADVVDAHVALMTAPADLVLTSNPGDIRQLLQARGIR